MNEKLVALAMMDALKRNGAFENDELFKTVQKLHGDLERGLFDEILMMLEIQGMIRVYSLSRERRRIELTR